MKARLRGREKDLGSTSAQAHRPQITNPSSLVVSATLRRGLTGANFKLQLQYILVLVPCSWSEKGGGRSVCLGRCYHRGGTNNTTRTLLKIWKLFKGSPSRLALPLRTGAKLWAGFDRVTGITAVEAEI